MNQFEMVVLIVLIVTVAGIFRARAGLHRGSRREGRWQRARQWTDDQQNYDRENEQLRDEVKALKERIAVLERIATDRSSSLESEIERLRDK